MSDEMTQLKITLDPDSESMKKTEKSFASLSSLLADLSIVGTVAGKALGQIWGVASKSIQVGVQEFQGSINALVRGFDASELSKLTEAMANIGEPGKQGAVISQVDAMLRSFKDPETGEKLLESTMEQFGRFNVDEGIQTALRSAFEEGDAFKSLMLLAQAINQGTDDELGSNLAEALKLQGLANLENDEQYSDFMGIMADSSDIYERNIERLDALNDSIMSLKASNDSLQSAYAEGLATIIEPIASQWREIAEELAWTMRGSQEAYDIDNMGASNNFSTLGSVLGSEAMAFESEKADRGSRLDKWVFEKMFTKGIYSEVANKAEADLRARGGLTLTRDGREISGTEYIESQWAEKTGQTVTIGEINVTSPETGRALLEIINDLQDEGVVSR